MVWWISGGIVLVGLVVLGLALGSLLGSLGRLAVVAHSLQRRLLDGADRLEPKARRLQETAEAMRPRLEAAEERMLVIQARRGTLDEPVETAVKNS